MNFKEKFKKFLDDKRLDREIKAARKKIADKEEEKVQMVNANDENKARQKNLGENIEKADSQSENRKFKVNVERLKDAGLIVVAVMLIGIGYVNFSGTDSSVTENQIIQTASEYSNNLGDVQLVNSDEAELVENDDSENVATVSNEEETIDVSQDSQTTDITAYFTELRLNRDNIYSQKLEAYQQIIDSSSISSEQKAIAIQEIEKITEIQNSIAIAEELIKLKGFDNVVIYVNETSVTVIVRSADLSTEQVAQIQNIVTRQLDIDASSISISNK